MAALGKSGNPLSLGLPVLLRFHRLAEPVALTIHLDNVAMVGEAVQECRGHPLSLEDLVQIAEWQIARHQDATALIAVGEDPEQQLDSPSAHRDVAQLVTNQELRPVELAEKPVERVLLLLLFQLADQRRGREEPHPQASATRCQAKSDRNMCLPSSVTPDKATVRFLVDPFTTPQLQDFRLGQTGHGTEIVGIEVLEGWELRVLDTCRDRVGR